MSFRHWIGFAAALMFAAPASAIPLVLNFEEFVHGEIVTISQGVIITTENFDNSAGHPDIAVAFDSNFGGATTDPDLLRGAGWTAGNLPSNTDLGNLLIVQENNNCGISICSDPDDQAGPGGQFTFDYSNLGSFDTFSFDLIDHEPNIGETGSIEFFLNGQSLGAATAFSSFVGVTYGGNSANRIDFGTIAEFDKVVIALRGSSAIDNLVASPVLVPEPNTMALGGLGLVMLASVGRKRDRA
jgi:hypothetical protein